MFRRASSRRLLVAAGVAAPVLATSYYTLTSQRGSSRRGDEEPVSPYASLWRSSPIYNDAPPSFTPQDNRPDPLWVPPSRAQMLAALKASTSKILRPKGTITDGGDHGAPADKDDDDDGFDLLIVGGGATGAGVAVDAATRGLNVALVERDDFAAGTSSKSTKLVHGGVRYLQKAVMELDYEQYKLVREALHERKTFLHIAPYLSSELPIMLPIYKWWQVPYYFAGTKMYDVLAGKQNMESSYFMGAGKALQEFPLIQKENLVGAVVYYDGQHNDARMNTALALTAVHHGAVVANHTEVVSLIKNPDTGKIKGARVRDVLTGEEWDVKAKGVINATGPFSDGLRQMDEPTAREIVSPSSGVHITLPGYFAKNMGLIDPATSDGRVIFFLPWQGNTIAGTTDAAAPLEPHPRPKEEEIQWILDEVRKYITPDVKVRRGDVLSAWSGLRPLVRDPAAKNTESLVRNHLINVSPSGLLTIAGGKWTTYRAMAEETVDRAVEEFGLNPVRECVTARTRLIGSHGWNKNMYVKLLQHFGLDTDVAKHLADTYGDRAWSVCSIAEPSGQRWPVHGTRLDPNYPYIEAEVRYACRSEYAQTATDFLARRSRLSFLNTQASLEALPRVIEIMASELGWDRKRQEKEFDETLSYLGNMGLPPNKTSGLKLKDMEGVRKARLMRAPVQQANDDALFSRAEFSTEEMEALRGKFEQLDVNKDGKLDANDLEKVLLKLGYRDVGASTVEGIIKEVDYYKQGGLHFEDFLDIVAGLKEVSLENAFTRILSSLPERQGGVDAVGEYAKEESERRKQARTIPVEKSGGGW